MIETREVNDVVVVEMAHGKVNAIDKDLARALTTTLADLAEDRRPVVLTGRGPCFSAGVDLRRLSGDGPEYVKEFMPALTEAFLAVFDYPAPLVAAINGHVLAGGYVIACGADWRVMADGSGQVGLTELLAGVPFPTAALEIVRFAVGEPMCRDLVLTGRRFNSSLALEAKLVDEVVPGSELLDVAVVQAAHLDGIPAATYELSKLQLHRTASDAIKQTTPRFEPQVNETWASKDILRFVADYIDRVTGK